MADPTTTFAYTYILNGPYMSGGQKLYSVMSVVNSPVTIQDVSDSAADNLSVIGDIPGDTFQASGTSSTAVYSYEATSMTAANGPKGIVTNNNIFFSNESLIPGQYIFENANDTYALCFAAGTNILTTRGDVDIQDLKIGDVSITVSGEHRTIRWLGHRVTNFHHSPESREAMPVRIAAHAFGESQPVRDLTLSAGHPVLVGADENGRGGYLVPIMCLINGTTIDRIAVDSVTYWHVELDVHDIILAEGLPAESYIDLGSRSWFAGADGALYDPDITLPGMLGRCRPVAVDGPVVDAERRRLDIIFATHLSAASAWPSAEEVFLAD